MVVFYAIDILLFNDISDARAMPRAVFRYANWLLTPSRLRRYDAMTSLFSRHAFDAYHGVNA